MSLRTDPAMAEHALATARAALEKDGVTGRVRAEGEGVAADLRVPIEEIGDERLPVVERLPEEFVTRWLDDTADDPWTGAGESRLDLALRRDASIVRLTGEATLGLKHVCVRCLDEIEFEIPLKLDLHLVVGLDSGSLSQGGQVELAYGMDGAEDDPLDDTDVIHFDGQTVDLGEIVREQVFLETPMHPACGGTFARVQEACSLDQDGALAAEKARWKDPRWAALEGLRDQLPDKPGED